jgi:hypothetical protein
MVEDKGQTPFRAADVDVKETAVGEFELVGRGHVDNVATPPLGPHGEPTAAGASMFSSWSRQTVL